MFDIKKRQEQREMMRKEAELFSYEGEDKIVSSEEMLKIVEERGTPDVMLNSKIPILDKTLGGFVGGELIVVSGITGEGKSLLCQTLTSNMAQQKINTLWFTYEMPPQYFIKKFGENTPLFYLPKELKTNTTNWLEERILEAKLKFDVQAIFIDHLHFLVDLAKIGNPSLEIGSIVRNIKKIALKHNIVIFLIAHTTKIKSGFEELGLGDIRDSSFIEQEADTVLYIWRKTEVDGIKVENRSVLKIAKNRRLGTKNIKINLILSEGNLVELDLTKPDGEVKPLANEIKENEEF